MSKLGLGTVQFGLDYGVSNQGGKTSYEEVEKIIQSAKNNNIQIIDTSQAYGDSEKALGKVGVNNLKVITKVLAGGRLESSLEQLKANSVYGVLAHSAEELIGSKKIWRDFQDYKKQSLVKKIGVSVYDAQQIDSILEKYEIDIIQLPLSVYDQRLLKSGHLKKLKDCGVEIHVRSCFLQGLLLMDVSMLPQYFDSIKTHHKKYSEFLHQHNLTAVQGALGFLYSIDEIDHIICGVNNLAQFNELYNIKSLSDSIDLSEFSIDDINITNPRLWNI